MGIFKVTSRFGLLLGFIALVCTAVSAGIYMLTKDKIDEAMAEHQKALLLQVIPQNYFNNSLLESVETPEQDKLKGIQKVYFAIKDHVPTAYAYETTAPDGYSGNIRLLGVRVIEHHETPGLGDKIELRISDWILSFTNQVIVPESLKDWAVKKDGGKFDQFSGATITPRAIVNQVKRSALVMLENEALLNEMAKKYAQ